MGSYIRKTRVKADNNEDMELDLGLYGLLPTFEH